MAQAAVSVAISVFFSAEQAERWTPSYIRFYFAACLIGVRLGLGIRFSVAVLPLFRSAARRRQILKAVNKRLYIRLKRSVQGSAIGRL